MTNNRKVIRTHTIINIIVTLILLIYMLFTWNLSYIDHSWTKPISIISLALLVYQIFFMCKLKVKMYDFRIWFSIFQYLFIFGRVYLNALNLDSNIFWNLMNYYDDVSMHRAGVFALIYIQSMFTGLFFKYSDNNIVEEKKDKFDVYESKKMNFIGIVMIIFSLPFKIYNDYLTIQTQRVSNGYVSLAIDNALFYAFGLLLPIGFIYIITAQKMNKRRINILIILYLLYTIGIMIFSGDRRYAVTSFLAIILCYLKTFNIKIGVKKTVKYAIFVILALFVLAAIRNARLYVIHSFSDFTDMLLSVITESNFFYETLAEFGLTFFIYAAVVKFFPSHFGFKYGTTYLFAPFTTLPMSGTFFPGMQEAVSAHIDCKSITNQSLGAAFGEELYGNFGLIAPLFAILAGILIAKLIDFNKVETNNPKKIAIYYSTFYILINLVRASTTEIFRLVVYSLFIPWFIGLFYKRKKRGV